MKKILFSGLTLIAISGLHAQEPADALRFSWYVPGATARIQAAGGAMGSLGGDVSATFVNPAGLGFYKTGDFVFTPAYRFGNAKSSYLGRTEKQNTSTFTWGTTGFVFGSGDGKSRIRSSAVSLVYN